MVANSHHKRFSLKPLLELKPSFTKTMAFSFKKWERSLPWGWQSFSLCDDPLLKATRSRVTHSALMALHALCWTLLLLATSYAEVFNAVFSPIATDSLPPSKFGRALPSALTRKECMLECTAAGEACTAFHVSGQKQCYHLIRDSAKNWSEQSSTEVVWMSRRASLDANCSESLFPFHRGRSRYRYEALGKAWQEAKQRCEGLGAKLVQVTTAEERMFIYYFVSPKAKDVLVGTRRGTAYVWEPSGDAVSLSGLWAPSEPTILDNGTVARMHYYSGKLYSLQPSTTSYGFVCECLIL